MTASAVGRIGWSLKRDRDGHRDYNLRMLVETTSSADGPGAVYFASGLPAIGVPWSFGNDSDPWAFCSPEATVSPIVTPDPNLYWTIDIPFTTKPFRRCQDTAVEDPILEPQQVSGSFVSYVKQLSKRADTGKLVLSSSHEPITGIEIDSTRPTVRIVQNVSDLELPLLTQLIHTTNDAPLWGLAANRIKLDSISWERKVYGSCYYYYTRTFDFGIKFEGFSITDIADSGFKEFDADLAEGDTAALRANPKNYMLIRALRGDSSPTKVNLDGNGSVNTNPVLSPTFLSPVVAYGESNFFLLDVPTSF